MKYLNKIIEKLKSNNVILEGCSKTDIENLQSSITNVLPKCYIEFLEILGQRTDAKNVKYGLYDYTGFQGESIFYDNVYGGHTNKDGLLEQLQEDDKINLIPQINDNNIFVFCSHQGYIYAFFKLNEGDNPPIYGYHEGQKENNFPKLTNSLLEFFEFYLEEGKDPYNALD